MSFANTTESIVLVCENKEDEVELVDTFAIAIGVLTIIGSIITYFIQQNQERKDAIEAKIKEDAELDRVQALERARKQVSVLIGPMHRAWKTQASIMAHYTIESGHGYGHVPEMLKKRGKAFWNKMFLDEFLQRFIDDPHSFEAEMYRNFVSRRLKPVYTRVRELVLNHMADLADMPSQDEWLERWTEEEATSPYNGSLNINVIFDSYSAWTFEYDDIVESWKNGDFRRMQPTMRFAFFLCNDLIDLLYDNAKAKEAKYNKHVSLHKNDRQYGNITNNDKSEKDVKWVKDFFHAAAVSSGDDNVKATDAA